MRPHKSNLPSLSHPLLRHYCYQMTVAKTLDMEMSRRSLRLALEGVPPLPLQVELYNTL